MLSMGSIKYPNKPQICILSKREISPAFLDEYCVLNSRSPNEKRNFTAFGEEVFSQGMKTESNFVVRIDTQIEFVCSKEVLEAIHPIALPAVHHNDSLVFYEEESSGFIIFMRVYNIDRCIEDLYLRKGQPGLARVMRLNDQDGNEVIQNVQLGEPVVTSGRFDYIRDEIIHILRTKDALLGIYNNDDKGRSLLQQVGDIRRSIKKPILDFSGNEDRAKFSYDPFFCLVLREYPNLQVIVEYMKQVRPAQFGEIPAITSLAQRGDASALNRLVDVHLRSILHMAYQYSKRYEIDFEDAFQNGVSGFIQAVPRYDESASASLSVYASFWIRQSIQRFSIHASKNVYVPVHVMESVVKIKSIVDSHFCSACNSSICHVLIRIVSEMIGCDEDHAVMYINLCLPTYSLANVEESAEAQSNISSYDKAFVDISDYGECIDNIETLIDQGRRNEFVHEIIDELKPRQKWVVELRYGIGAEAPCTLNEIGGIAHLTRERIRQIEKKALERIGKKCELSRFDWLVD